MVHAAKGNIDVSRLIEIWNREWFLVGIPAPVEAIVVLRMTVAEGVNSFGFIGDVLKTLARQGVGHAKVGRAIVSASEEGRRGNQGEER